MRFLLIACLGAVFAASPMAANAAGNRQQRVQARPAVSQQAVVPQRVNHPVAVPQQGRVQAVVQRSAPMRGQFGVARNQRAASAVARNQWAASAAGSACSSRRGTAQCRPTRMSWTQGLSPAAGIQANECPNGTMATLARGHDDIVRCMLI